MRADIKTILTEIDSVELLHEIRDDVIEFVQERELVLTIDELKRQLADARKENEELREELESITSPNESASTEVSLSE